MIFLVGWKACSSPGKKYFLGVIFGSHLRPCPALPPSLQSTALQIIPQTIAISASCPLPSHSLISQDDSNFFPESRALRDVHPMRLGLRPVEALPLLPNDIDDDDVAIRRHLDGSHVGLVVVLSRLLPQVEIGTDRIGTGRVRLVPHPPDRSHMRGDVVLPHGGG